MRRVIAMGVVLAMLTTGCASAGGPRRTTTVATTMVQPGVVGTAAMADYVQHLPAGSRVRVERTDGTAVRGMLMKASADVVVVQKNTRVPEPPIEVPLGQLARVTVENGGSSTGKAIAIGIASGVGAFFGALAILAATWGD
jgi:hypothetical protein